MVYTVDVDGDKELPVCCYRNKLVSLQNFCSLSANIGAWECAFDVVKQEVSIITNSWNQTMIFCFFDQFSTLTEFLLNYSSSFLTTKLRVLVQLFR